MTVPPRAADHGAYSPTMAIDCHPVGSKVVEHQIFTSHLLRVHEKASSVRDVTIAVACPSADWFGSYGFRLFESH